MDSPRTLIRIHPSDNVAVAIGDLTAGTRAETSGREIVLRENIRAGHKVAIEPIAPGGLVVKYGFPIGRAVAAIMPGQHVHTHNLRTRLSGVDDDPDRRAAATLSESASSRVPEGAQASRASPPSFDGYERSDGAVGIRNEVWIIPTVGCVNKVCSRLAAEGRRRFADAGLDGIHAFEHPYGCSQLGDDLAHTQHILADLVRHPNAGGVLVVGLGCENNNLPEFRKVLGEVDPQHVRFLASQEVGDELTAGMELMERLVARAGTATRRPVSASKLVVGLKCGGSDGFSGITANPLLGMVSDRLTAWGATTLLTEVPEMFGAEDVLMTRCADRNIFDRCRAMIDDFKRYYLRHGQPIHENPSPGNREGGITTLEEKSLGCVQKGGRSPVVDVLDYGQRVCRGGLNLVSGPGNDAVSVTALAAAGAQVILFTTGRGTPLGGPVPTVKISARSELAERKPHWIDFDAGTLLGGESMSAAADRLIESVLRIVSGRRRSRNEESDAREVALFKDGVTL